MPSKEDQAPRILGPITPDESRDLATVGIPYPERSDSVKAGERDRTAAVLSRIGSTGLGNEVALVIKDDEENTGQVDGHYVTLDPDDLGTTLEEGRPDAEGNIKNSLPAPHEGLAIAQQNSPTAPEQ